MANGCVRRTVGTIKKDILNTLYNKDSTWLPAIYQMLYVYRHRRIRGALSPFHLRYALVTHMSHRNLSPFLNDHTGHEVRDQLLLTIQSARSDRDLAHPTRPFFGISSCIGDHLVVARGRPVGARKILAFQITWLGPFTVESADNARYLLHIAHGRFSRCPF